MQTLLVLARDPRLIRDLGLARFAAVALMLTTLVTGPLLSPVAVAVIGLHLARHGVPHPRGAMQAAEATLAVSVFWQGIASTLWCGYIGIRARGLERFLPSLPAFVPYQLLISAAAWGGAIDLFRNPHHWRKTDHSVRSGAQERRSSFMSLNLVSAQRIMRNGLCAASPDMRATRARLLACLERRKGCT